MSILAGTVANKLNQRRRERNSALSPEQKKGRTLRRLSVVGAGLVAAASFSVGAYDGGRQALNNLPPIVTTDVEIDEGTAEILEFDADFREIRATATTTSVKGSSVTLEDDWAGWAMPGNTFQKIVDSEQTTELGIDSTQLAVEFDPTGDKPVYTIDVPGKAIRARVSIDASAREVETNEGWYEQIERNGQRLREVLPWVKDLEHVQDSKEERNKLDSEIENMATVLGADAADRKCKRQIGILSTQFVEAAIISSFEFGYDAAAEQYPELHHADVNVTVDGEPISDLILEPENDLLDQVAKVNENLASYEDGTITWKSGDASKCKVSDEIQDIIDGTEIPQESGNAPGARKPSDNDSGEDD